MAVISKTRQAVLAAEAAADKGTAPTGKHHDLIPVVEQPKLVMPDGPAYRLADYVMKEVDGVVSWTAKLLLGRETVVAVSWNGAKCLATLSPLAKTTGAEAEVQRLEKAAARLLPGKSSVQDLIQVLIFTSEPGITPFNRAALTASIKGSYEIAMRPELIVA